MRVLYANRLLNYGKIFASRKIQKIWKGPKILIQRYTLEDRDIQSTNARKKINLNTLMTIRELKYNIVKI